VAHVSSVQSTWLASYTLLLGTIRVILQDLLDSKLILCIIQPIRRLQVSWVMSNVIMVNSFLLQTLGILQPNKKSPADPQRQAEARPRELEFH